MKLFLVLCCALVGTNCSQPKLSPGKNTKWESGKFRYIGDLPKAFRAYIFSGGVLNGKECNLLGKSSKEVHKILGNPVTQDKYQGKNRYFYQCKRELLSPLVNQEVSTLWLMIVFNQSNKVIEQEHGIITNVKLAQA